MAKHDSEFKKAFWWLVGHDAEFLQRYHRMIHPSTWENPEDAWYLEQCLTYYDKYERPMTAKALKLLLAKKKDNDKFDKDMVEDRHGTEAPDEDSLDFLRDFADDWLRRRMSEVLMQDFADAIDDADANTIQDLLTTGLDRLSISSTDEPAIGAISNRAAMFEEIQAMWENGMAIPTGIDSIDAIMNGGARSGELCTFLAPPGHGKSQWLTYVSRTAWRAGNNVLYITLEMSEPWVALRFYAPILDTPARDVHHLESGDFERRMAKFLQNERLADIDFVIKRFPAQGASAGDIRQILNQHKDRGTPFDMLVVDYGDILAPIKKSENRKEAQWAVFTELRCIAVEYDIPVWTASQTNREALRKRTITIENIADDFDKAKISDCIIAQSQTAREKDVGEARLYMAKCRYNGQGEQVRVNLDFAYSNYSENTTGSAIDEDETP